MCLLDVLSHFIEFELQKHVLIKQLERDLAEARKGEGSKTNTATINGDATIEKNVSPLWLICSAYICTWAHVQLHMHADTHTHTHTHTRTKAHTRTHAFAYTHTHTHKSTHTHACFCIHTHTHTHAQKHTHTHTHTQHYSCALSPTNQLIDN